ncbi:sugar phosphate isomerase/epimerase [Verrucomicrobia bacterium]|jgi:sugar phosphate isomerase/epimerase|nr:TIM barrel protein [Verrucomicrobiota bacterium]MDA7511169.1 sugar phosphate isomerase/epimerase [Verrucomicrobiota bacterium]MDA7645113.1 sugar phosphate isomerase/epimerase [bacterium]MDA7657528.1 sugar phosphate isomerase/epimerase [Verrucomicrobiota bacterium]
MTRSPSDRQLSRRNLLKQTCLLGSIFALPQFRIHARERDWRDRIALSSSTFRSRFKSTQSGTESGKAMLTLESLPQFAANRFEIRQLEYWSLHFESQERSYLDRLKTTATRAGSKLINLQIDGPYRLASPNKEKRTESINKVKRWIDVASYLGMPSARANPGKGDFESVIQSFKELNQYAKSKGVLLLTENHFGMETDPAVHLRIHDEINDKEFKLIPDFGNYHSNLARYEALAQIMPLAHLVSAKVMDLDKHFQHTTFDYNRCLEIATQSEFSGVFSIEQWSKKTVPHPPEEVVDWAVKQIVLHLELSNQSKR